jgi:anaerobic selenocysteine-containing dehydrogenase
MSRYNPPLQVVQFIGTRKGDADRGPQVQMNAAEAALRMVQNGELVWVNGPRRNEVAELVINDAVPRGGVVARDIVGLSVTDIVRITKTDVDRPRRSDLA